MKPLSSISCSKALKCSSRRLERLFLSARRLAFFSPRKVKKTRGAASARKMTISKASLRRIFALVLLTALFISLATAVDEITATPFQVIAPNSKPVVLASVKAESLPTDIQYPVTGATTTYFSFFHPGIDLAVPFGTPVRPLGSGKVTNTRYDLFGKGNVIEIDHSDGLASQYAHLSKILVKSGDTVTLYTEIGKIGSTGFSTGPHLHFEVYDHGKPVNPLTILPKE